MKKHIQSFNETTDNKDQHLLIVHHEGGDEIHFTVLDYSLYPQIDEIIKSSVFSPPRVDTVSDLIHNNTLEKLVCQTYVFEDYAKIAKYNIVKCIHLSELAC